MRWRLASAATAGAAAVLMMLGACSDDSTPAQTPTTQASSQSVTPSRTASGPIPTYPGATVVSHVGGFTLLHTDDSVSKVGSFYVDALARDGWTTVSKYQGEFSVNLMARRDGKGVTVQVSPTGSGTSISITTYSV
ncbi:hypothetical protein ABZZ20_22250 [Streptomyces sp. NPDC006430]|uniref:hypothetical protein n=1 Tax=Streptomyces sp. NPDC006430 TaxID=3154299 RepID=UPI0033B7C0F5